MATNDHDAELDAIAAKLRPAGRKGRRRSGARQKTSSGREAEKRPREASEAAGRADRELARLAERGIRPVDPRTAYRVWFLIVGVLITIAIASALWHPSLLWIPAVSAFAVILLVAWMWWDARPASTYGPGLLGISKKDGGPEPDRESCYMCGRPTRRRQVLGKTCPECEVRYCRRCSGMLIVGEYGLESMIKDYECRYCGHTWTAGV
jgi:hypothetical protein